MRIFLSKKKRDEWVDSYIDKHNLVGVACGRFLMFYTASILGRIRF